MIQKHFTFIMIGTTKPKNTFDPSLLEGSFTFRSTPEMNEKGKDVLETYTSMFWKPKYRTLGNTNSLKRRYYHIQAAPKPGLFSPLIRKNPKLFKKLINKIVSPGDFFNVSYIVWQDFDIGRG